jgi:hypothetical protein
MFDFISNLSALTAPRRGPGDPLVPPPAPPQPLWLKWLAALWIANFVVYVLAATYLGGDAINGHVIEGHYFLGYKGRFTEVSRPIYLYSRWHTIGLFAYLGALMLVSAFVEAKRKRNA